MFAIEFRSLELSEHQKAMLETPESRIAKLIFPASIRARATLKRRQKRKSKWSEKFRGVFLGRSSKKWGQTAQRRREPPGRGARSCEGQAEKGDRQG